MSSSCNLMSETGIFIQMLLGALCLMSLIIKKATEKPSRKWKIFLYDTFKQMIGQVSIHFINIYLAMSLSEFKNEDKIKADQCSWYFITFLIDLFPGLVILYSLSSLFDAIFTRVGATSLVAGNYIEENDGEIFIKYGVYWVQIVIWMTILVLTKLLLFALQVPLIGVLSLVASVTLGVLKFSSDFKLFFVMIIFPLCVNVLVFWISDNLLKKKVFYEGEEGLRTSYYEEEPTFVVKDRYLQTQMKLIGGNGNW